MRRGEFPTQYHIFKVATWNYVWKWKAKGHFRRIALANVIKLIYKQRGKDYEGYIDEIPYHR